MSPFDAWWQSNGGNVPPTSPFELEFYNLAREAWMAGGEARLLGYLRRKETFGGPVAPADVAPGATAPAIVEPSAFDAWLAEASHPTLGWRPSADPVPPEFVALVEAVNAGHRFWKCPHCGWGHGVAQGADDATCHECGWPGPCQSDIHDGRVCRPGTVYPGTEEKEAESNIRKGN